MERIQHMSELHPIISARFSDHVDTLSATYGCY